MPKASWGRIFETCKTSNNNAIIAAGHPIYLRSRWGLRSFLIPAVSAADITSMLADIISSQRWIPMVGGVFFDFRHDPGCRFRVAVLGHSDSPSVLVTRLSGKSPSQPLEVGQTRASSIQSSPTLDRILATCAEGAYSDAVFVPNCPPIIWSERDFAVLSAPPLGNDTIASMFATRAPPLENILEENDYQSFPVWHGSIEFRAAILGKPILACGLAMRLPPRNA